LKILQDCLQNTSELKLNETSREDVSSSFSTAASTVAPSSSETASHSNEVPDDSLSEENEKAEAENIQDNANQQQENDLEEDFARNGLDKNKSSLYIFGDKVANEPALHSGHFALIFASVLVVFSVIAYVGLILWRGALERRYGMRQRLVTEDDYYNNNDVRYFGL